MGATDEGVFDKLFVEQIEPSEVSQINFNTRKPHFLDFFYLIPFRSVGDEQFNKERHLVAGKNHIWADRANSRFYENVGIKNPVTVRKVNIAESLEYLLGLHVEGSFETAGAVRLFVMREMVNFLGPLPGHEGFVA